MADLFDPQVRAMQRMSGAVWQFPGGDVGAFSIPNRFRSRLLRHFGEREEPRNAPVLKTVDPSYTPYHEAIRQQAGLLGGLQRQEERGVRAALASRGLADVPGIEEEARTRSRERMLGQLGNVQAQTFTAYAQNMLRKGIADADRREMARQFNQQLQFQWAQFRAAKSAKEKAAKWRIISDIIGAVAIIGATAINPALGAGVAASYAAGRRHGGTTQGPV